MNNERRETGQDRGFADCTGGSISCKKTTQTKEKKRVYALSVILSIMFLCEKIQSQIL